MADTLSLEKLQEPLPQSTQLTRFTVPDVTRLAEAGVLRDDRRYELINGLLHEMHAPGPNHQQLVRNLVYFFEDRLREHGIDPRHLVLQGEALYFSEATYRLPDLMVLAAPPLEDGKPRFVRPSDVQLVIEVSVSTYKGDVGDKLRRYARGGIPEYWIVRVDADDWTHRVLEVRRKPVDEDYREVLTLEYGDAAFTLESEKLRPLGPLRVDDVLG
ncbi:MAG: Uma2 family endonuclease [Rhodothermales bacterium]